MLVDIAFYKQNCINLKYETQKSILNDKLFLHVELFKNTSSNVVNSHKNIISRCVYIRGIPDIALKIVC